MTINMLNALATCFPVMAQSTVDAAPLCGLTQPMLTLLARGEPVSTDAIAAATSRSPEETRTALDQLSCIERDEQGRVVGMGLSLRPTAHRFEVEGRMLFTWCALDALMLPIILDKPARVVSPCHATGELVRLTITPHGIVEQDPPHVVISIVEPHDLASIRSVFCENVHLFLSTTVASCWVDKHPGATIVPVAEGFRLAQLITQKGMS